MKLIKKVYENFAYFLLMINSKITQMKEVSRIKLHEQYLDKCQNDIKVYEQFFAVLNDIKTNDKFIKKIKQIENVKKEYLKAEASFFKVLTKKVDDHELTFLRFKQSLDSSSIVIGEKIKNSNAIIEILKQMDDGIHGSELLVQSQLKEIDDNLDHSENLTNKVYELSFQINKMKNKEAISLDYESAMKELDVINENLKHYLK